MKDIIVLEENDLWRISMIDGDTDIVTVSMSSTPPVGSDFAPEQFRRLASEQGKAIFLIDKTSSYGNRLDWPAIIELLTPHLQGKTVRTIGACMGGFLAAVLSKFFKVKHAVMLVPTYGVTEEHFPPKDYEGDRFDWFLDLYTHKIDVFHIPSLEGYFQDETTYYVFNGDNPMDQMQAEYFPQQENVIMFDFGSDYGHSLPGDLGDDLDILVQECFNGRPEAVYDYILSHYSSD
jgi:hypothetical protein